MKKAVIFLCAFLASVVWAEDYKTPHTLQSGELLSADVFNENFEVIKKARELIKTEDLIGTTWQCQGCRRYVSGYQNSPANNPFTADTRNLLLESELATIQFGTETFDNPTGTENPFYNVNYGPVSFELWANVMFISIPYTPAQQTHPNTAAYQICKISDTRVVFKLSSANNNYFSTVILCDKTSVPPSKPLVLTSTAFIEEILIEGVPTEVTNITFNWVDDSDTETGFKIFRKNAIDDSWVEVGIVDANVTEFVEQLEGDGPWWGRVKATNEHGDSLGTNVVLVEKPVEP